MSSHDAYIISDIAAIMNPDNMRQDIDLADLEKQMIQGGLLVEQTRDPQARFDDELRNVAKTIGISFDDIVGDSDVSRSPSPERRRMSPERRRMSPPPERDRSPPRRMSPERRRMSPPRREYLPEYSTGYASPIIRGGELHERTLEQQRREQIGRVMGNRDQTFSIESENRDDLKSAMLGEIETLKQTLLEEDGNTMWLEKLPYVDYKSDFDLVQSVMRQLRSKHDTTRAVSFAEEVFLFGAYSIEEVFNGERTYFGRYRPDMRGWHNHVNAKLRRMRCDTSQVVQEFIKNNPISPGMRIALELIPNGFIYSKRKKQQDNEPGLDYDDNVGQFSRNLRDL